MPITALGSYEIAVLVGKEDARHEIHVQKFAFYPWGRLLYMACVVLAIALLLFFGRCATWLWLALWPLIGLGLYLFVPYVRGTFYSSVPKIALPIFLAVPLLPLWARVFRRKRRVLFFVGTYCVFLVADFGTNAVVFSFRLAWRLIAHSAQGVLLWWLPMTLALLVLCIRFSRARLAVRLFAAWLLCGACYMLMVYYADFVKTMPVFALVYIGISFICQLALFLHVAFDPWSRKAVTRALGLD